MLLGPVASISMVAQVGSGYPTKTNPSDSCDSLPLLGLSQCKNSVVDRMYIPNDPLSEFSIWTVELQRNQCTEGVGLINV